MTFVMHKRPTKVLLKIKQKYKESELEKDRRIAIGASRLLKDSRAFLSLLAT